MTTTELLLVPVALIIIILLSKLTRKILSTRPAKQFTRRVGGTVVYLIAFITVSIALMGILGLLAHILQADTPP